MNIYVDKAEEVINNSILHNTPYYNINNEFNSEFKVCMLNKNGRYPNIKAYMKCDIDALDKKYDSDVSEYSMTYYINAWDFLKGEDVKIVSQDTYNKFNYKKEIRVNEIVTIRGDTLNSMKTPFNNFFQMVINLFSKNAMLIFVKNLSHGLGFTLVPDGLLQTNYMILIKSYIMKLVKKSQITGMKNTILLNLKPYSTKVPKYMKMM